MNKIRAAQTVIVLGLLTACAGKDKVADSTAAADSAAAAAAAAAPAAPAAPTLASFAGTWEIASTLVGVEKPVPGTLASSADGSTWTLSLEGRPNIPVQASISGDSLIAQSAEYESVLRKGVMVTTRTAAVMSNGALTGNMTATYKTKKGDEVVNGTVTGTRKQ